MDSRAMKPYGAALLAYWEGDHNAELVLRCENGREDREPVSDFFRQPSAFTPIEKAAIENCFGYVLDVGAGTGLHSLVLQEKGSRVTAVDISPQAVQIMTQRGVLDVRCVDLFDYEMGPSDTILIMGNGIGMVETLAGLDRFFAHARGLLSGEGQVLLDSADVRITDNPQSLAYQESLRRAGRYVGEIRLQLEYRGRKGPYCGWLQVDTETLEKHAVKAGWECELIIQEGKEYLARLIRRRSAGQSHLLPV